MTRREMSKTERAARDAMAPYVRNGLISQATANKTIRDGLGLVETTVRSNYSSDQAFYYAGKIAEAREKHEAATGFMGRVMAAGRLMICEMYAAVYAVVREERGDTDVPMDQAVETMTTVRDTAREVREAYRVTIEHHHPNGGMIGAGTRKVEAADKDEAARIAVAEKIAAAQAKNAKARAEMARTGQTWPLDSEDPKDYVVQSVRKAPKRRAVAV
ncbi:hypothetical protein [Streptomyces africanus]|uniref:hypothetical protein n=1 Tax=Streptomyces africanus TaxID=231024 RepID=UPI00117FAD56|nr:hypothetical protein [Streptomyces africanus]